MTGAGIVLPAASQCWSEFVQRTSQSLSLAETVYLGPELRRKASGAWGLSTVAASICRAGTDLTLWEGKNRWTG